MHARAAQHLHLQFLDLLFDQLARQFERILRVQRFEHLRAQLLANGFGELALHVGAHFSAQRFEVAIGNAEALGERLVERRRHLLFDLARSSR